MAGWGDVLEAMHLAPRGVRTVRLELEQERGDGRTSSSAEDATGRGDRGSDQIGISTTIVRGSSEGGLSFSGDLVAPAMGPMRSTLWFDAETGRYRVDHGARTMIFDGRRRWHPLGKGRIHVQEANEGNDHQLSLLLVNPEVLVGWCTFTDVHSSVHLTRECMTLTGTKRQSPAFPLLDMILPGRDVHAIVDSATGVVLALRLSNGTTPAARLDVVECAYDDFDPDDMLNFEPGPGTTVLTTADLRREAEARGIRTGPATVDLALQTVLVGPPPADPDAARSAIRYAVEHLTDIDEHDRCPHIQGGENLADCVRQTRRSPFVGDEGASFVCGDITFVRADEATVRFRVSVTRAPMGGIDTDGRALLIDGRWVIDRVTVCRLFSMASVECPPPPD